MPAYRPALVFALAAVGLLAPSLVVGTQYSHSATGNVNWALQFADQVRAGILYPRWMSLSFRDLGSPAFYFYPPAAFWLDGAISAVTLNALSVSYRLVVTTAVLLWLSGMTMHAWLKAELSDDRLSDQRMALIGALLYMAAPYHLVDHYIRAAFAEFAAIAVIPVVMLGLRRLAGGAPYGVAVTAAGYAALLFSHLPVALLCSATLFPAYVVWRVRRPGRLLLAGAIGIGLAAIYLAPALSLQQWISAEWLWSEYYKVDVWFLTRPGDWPDSDTMKIVAALAACYGLAGVALILQARTTRFWAVLCLVCLALMAGVVPWFWQLPELAKVQFPWRMMPIVEFTLITALCSVPGLRVLRAWPRALFLVAGAAMVFAAVQIVANTATLFGLTRQLQTLPRIEAREYEPHGFPQIAGEQPGNLALRQAAAQPLIACGPGAKVCEAMPGAFGTLRLTVESDAPTKVTLRRFYFPAWQLDPPLAIAPSEPFRLVSFVAPAGRSDYRLYRPFLPVEQWGWAVSVLAFVALLFAVRRSL